MIEALIVIGGVIGIAAVGLFFSGRMIRWWSSATYALLTASLVIVMVAGYYALDTENSIAYLWYVRSGAAAIVVASACLYFLTQELGEKESTRGVRVTQWLAAFSALAIIGIAFSSALVSDMSILLSGDKVAIMSWGIIVYAAWIIVIGLLVAMRVIREVRSAYHRRHGVLDVRYVAVRTLTYVLSLVVVAGLYTISLHILGVVFVNDDVVSRGFVGPILVASALMGAIIFQPVKKLLNRGFDWIFYRDNYSTDGFVVAMSQTLNSTNDLRTLLERTASLISQMLRARQVFFFVNLLEDRYMTAGTHGHSHVSPADFEGVLLAKENRNTPMLISQFTPKSSIYRMMVSRRLSVVMPLYKGDGLVGYLCLGRPAKAGYTNRDLRSLRSVADELTIAIQNAQSVEEVKKLNDTLEQRIDTATRELRASNAQLQRLDEAKDEFISMASHQLRTPLTSIKGYISMLLEGDAGKITKDQEHFLSEAFVSSERMVRLIGDFLNVSRLQTGKFVIDKHPVDLGTLVEHEVDALSQNATARGVSFRYKKPKDLPSLELDEAKVQQVVMNFLDNAMYYSKEKSKILVELKKYDTFVEFKVVDSGIGIPKSEQSQLFNKFFRATNARRARPDGTGVGLFLAKRVIDEHGGTVLFESEEGKGSTFGFRLPLPRP